MKSLVTVLASVVVFSAVSVAVAADSPAGTWKWSQTFNNQTRESTLKLKLDGDKLSGAIVGRNDNETAIEDASFKDGEIKFKVTRERNGNKTTTTYKGKLSGDTIKGTIESDRANSTARDWEAKRSKE